MTEEDVRCSARRLVSAVDDLISNGPNDVRWMRRCAELAASAKAAGNTPVGSLVVKDGLLLAEAAEASPRGDRAFGHAELLAVEAALLAHGKAGVAGATLYSTAEPCILCGFAVREARIARVVMGRSAGEIGSTSARFPVLSADWVSRWGLPPEVEWWNAEPEV